MRTTVRVFLGVVICLPLVGGAVYTCTTPERSLSGDTVFIDITPGSFPNAINPRSPGLIAVAILTNEDFYAQTVDPQTVRFGKTGTEASAVQAALHDIDGDGTLDLLLHFRIPDTGIQCRDTSASFNGYTTSGQVLRGSASLETVGCM
jgi:hypothetical protein